MTGTEKGHIRMATYGEVREGDRAAEILRNTIIPALDINLILNVTNSHLKSGNTIRATHVMKDAVESIAIELPIIMTRASHKRRRRDYGRHN